MATTHYWKFTFPTDAVIHKANQSYSEPVGNVRGQTRNVRGENLVGRDISIIFDDYVDVVKPLIDGKYSSRSQIILALRIIQKKLKGDYKDCFHPEFFTEPGGLYIGIRNIISNVGWIGVDVTKHIVNKDKTEIKNNGVLFHHF